MVRKVFGYAVGFVAAPQRTIDALAADASGVWAGFWWALLFLLAYSVTVFAYWLLGH